MAEAITSSVNGFGDEDWAVVVGIDHYRHEDIPDLEGAREDGRRFVRWLRARKHGNLQNPQQVIGCFSRGNYTGTSLTDIREAFGKLIELKTSANARMGRRLYIFASAHGGGVNVRDSAIYLSETSSAVTTAFSLSAMADAFRERGWFDEVVLFMDCCRTHDHTLTHVSTHSLSGFQLGPVAQVPADSYFYCFACEFQKETEEVFDGYRYRGFFSTRLLRGLKGEAADEYGRITAPSLKAYLQDGMGGSQPAFDHRDSFATIVFGQKSNIATTFTLELPPDDTEFELLALSTLTPLSWASRRISARKFEIERASRINALVRTSGGREKFVQPHERFVVVRGS
jgi:hypothetical protein